MLLFSCKFRKIRVTSVSYLFLWLIVAASLLGFLPISAQAQQSEGYAGSVRTNHEGISQIPVSYSRDFLLLQLGHDVWSGLPTGISTRGWNRDFNIALLYDFPFQQSHFSFALGLGVSTSNVFFKNYTLNIADSVSSQLNFTSDSKYSKYKIATTYLEIPLEFRFRQVAQNANKGFKVALGAKLGLNTDAHAKGKRVVAGFPEVEKFKTRRFFNPYRVAATARIGWGNFNLYGSYSLTPLFRQNTGLDVHTYSIGICLSGL
ncbi:outer membrane beta-barrel protein [Thermoflavifilum thermophilum]|uniref:Outer membrane protein beta-barrel domain-containing protein n=1 Tax=Thermoflavifilum thermophilum TaxID=1393122 RepID=A0A1I7NCD9_9BACT|nr:outer membrane beta-barrel protein [Thermoflavifilum thermophilum]SFV32319.1 Outer membrane protein beta-barrel domain-containing protein [Thermoflavifilum thermophilum]